MTPGSNGTGITYPTIELGGKVYTVKFTRGGLLYRLSKQGTNLADLRGSRNFATLVDVLFAGLYGQYEGTSEDLAELILSENKSSAMDEVIAEALKKVTPSTNAAAAAAEPIAQSRT